MSFKNNLRLIFIFVLSIVCYSCINAQTPLYKRKDSLDLALDSLIHKEFYENPNKDLKIVFTLKIDSIGEVHSAHIRKSSNLRIKKTFTICYEIESNFNLKFLYDRYKNRIEFAGKKYVMCNYPYSSNRKK